MISPLADSKRSPVSAEPSPPPLFPLSPLLLLLLPTSEEKAVSFTLVVIISPRWIKPAADISERDESRHESTNGYGPPNFSKGKESANTLNKRCNVWEEGVE